MPRLSPDKERLVEDLLRLGYTYRQIAKMAGVSQPTIARIAKRLRESEDMDAEDDVKSMLSIVRSRLDPRHPALQKLIVDTSWWFHVILDFSKQAIPELMGYLSSDEVDVEDPEATAKNIVRKLRMIKTSYERAKKLEAEAERLRRENEELRELIDEYDEALETVKNFAEEMKKRVKEMLVFLVRTVPRALSGWDRAVYMHVVFPKIRELWGVEI